MNALVIINPRAGKERGKQYLFSIADTLCKAGYKVTVHITQASGDATNIVRNWGAEYDRIICCGGDGTFQETVTGALALPSDSRPSIGYIPCGTTNDLSKSMDVPTIPDDNIANVVSGNYQNMDIGVFNDRIFTYIASFGTFSSVSYETPQSAKNLLGHTAYVLNGISQVFKIHPIHMRWQCDELSGEGDYLFGGVSNTTSIGGMYKLPPSAVSLDDGMFELILIKNGEFNIDLVPKLIAKRFNEESGNRILILKGKHFVLDFDQPIPFTLDGEFGGEQTHVEIDCLQGAIRFASGNIRHHSSEEVTNNAT